MTDQINLSKVGSPVHKRAWRSGRHLGGDTWQSADAARFFYKGQCYNAGSESETKCELCGKRVRLCYVLKVVQDPSLPHSPEVGKLLIGECCFKPIKAVNEKLYRQLLAAAVNLRTFMEAIERDQRVFAESGGAPESFDSSQLRPSVDEELARQLFEGLLGEGGDHA
jgi:hypothetical protein